MPSGKSAKTQRFNLATTVGIGCIALSLTLLFAIFWPVVIEELGFRAKQMTPSQPKEMIPIDSDFGIVIPKLGANAKVIPNIDPYNSRVYQVALTQGVAHAKGTSVPGGGGNIFLFSHSSVNFYEATRYNSVFYLLTKLETDDEVDLYYKSQKYPYTVVAKKTVSANAVEYLKSMPDEQETVTLMTCWPPGTTYKRLLVIAERAQ
jgi:sortase A